MSTLAQLSDVKAWILPTPPASDDTLLARLIQAASDYIETWLNRTILVGSYVETYSGVGGTRLVLPNYPLRSVASLAIDGITIPQSTSPTTPGWVLASNWSVGLRGGYRFTPGMANVAISYQAGYDTIPNEIAQACIELVARRYKKRDRIGVTSKGMAGEQVVFDVSDFSDNIKETLLQYRRVMPA